MAAEDMGFLRSGSRARSPSGVAVEARGHAPPADRRAGELADRLRRRRRADLDQAERLLDLDPPDIALGETRLADERADQILGRRAILLADVEEDLHPPGDGGGERSGLFTLPLSPFPKQGKQR